MAYTQEKNLITYTGRVYTFVFDLEKRKVVDGFVPKALNQNNIYTRIIEFYLKNPKADGLMEAIIKHFGAHDSYFYECLNEHIDLIKNKWKRFIQLDSEMPCHDIIDWLKLPFEMTDLELSLYRYLRIADHDLLKKYAYQYSKYQNLITHSYDWDDFYEIIKKVDKDIQKPSQFIDFLKYLIDRSRECQDLAIINGIAEQYEKHKFIEGETDDYVFIVPSTLDMIKNEADQQHNCVYNLYRNDISNGKAFVFFVRKKENVNHSYITCEWNTRSNCSLKQCYYANNRETGSHIQQLITDYILEKIASRG